MTKWINHGWAAIGFSLLLSLTMLITNVSHAQDSWGSERTESDTRTRQPSRNQTRAADGRAFRGYDDYVGPYAQFGVSIGVIEYDNRIDVDAGGGFTMTGGYRLLSWLSGEGNVTYVGGGDAEVGNTHIGDADFFAFTFGPKFYPMAAFDEPPIPEFVQPYGLVGIGGGEYDIDGNRNSGGDRERSTFIARFIFGFDIWITDHIGTFVEGGYHAAADDDVDGTGVFSFGGQYRF